MADTPPVRKFLFDKSFDGLTGAHPAAAPERKPVTLKPEQVDALKKEAWDSGFAAGQKVVAEEQSRRLAATLAQIENRMGQLIDNFQAVIKEQEAQTRRAVLAIARKILPAFVSRHGLEEIEPLLAGAIGDMLREPRLVVRVHESQFDMINAQINEITAQKAYAGKVVMLADATIAPAIALLNGPMAASNAM